MSEDLVSRLRGVDLFEGFSKRALQQLVRSGREVEHRPGHEVAIEGGSGYAFHLVLDGSAHVDVAGAGRPDMHAGDYFGEISLIDGKPRSATVKAGDDGLRAFAISGFEFTRLLGEQPELTKALLVNLCARIRSIEAAQQG